MVFFKLYSLEERAYKLVSTNLVVKTIDLFMVHNFLFTVF